MLKGNISVTCSLSKDLLLLKRSVLFAWTTVRKYTFVLSVYSFQGGLHTVSSGCHVQNVRLGAINTVAC